MTDLTEEQEENMIYNLLVEYLNNKEVFNNEKLEEIFYKFNRRETTPGRLEEAEKILYDVGYNSKDFKKFQEEFKKKKLETKKNSNLNADILELLDEPEINIQYLDIGESKNIFYYGINIAGREAIVTSNKKILRNTYEKFKDREIGKNDILDLIDYDGYLSDIATLWSRSSVKDFITSDNVPEKKECYLKIKDKIDFYMDFDKYEHSSSVQACWVMATYVYPLFYWFPHLLINAPSGSGKSKNGFILMQLSFRGFDLGASAGVTPAQIFRTIEGNRGTAFIDEFEKIDNDSQKLVNQILNASATRDAYVIRTEQINKKWKSWKFPIFCPKIVCNITGINPTSLSRFIGFNLLKTTTVKGKRKPYRQKDKEAFKPIRDELHILMLNNWKDIKRIYETLELNLSNRDEDNWLPVCAIAKWLGEDVFDEVNKFIDSYKDLVIETSDLTETLFLKILDNVKDTEDYYSSKEIAEWMTDELTMYKAPDRWIGRKLTEYKFKAVHKKKGNCYLLSKENIQNIINRYFGTQKTSETSLSSLSSITSQTTPISQKSQKNQNNKENIKDSINEGEVSEQSEVFLDGLAGEELIEIPDKINRKQEILSYLRMLKETEGKQIIAISELEKCCNPGLDLDKSIQELCRDGDLFKPQADKVSLL